ncbi:FCD domain-containing protein [Ancylobacter sp. G4_0304]|uniref:FCD domain-containing protein n=1 Tax=Ancylobacter sp. G4_0304 TaxID=3114289 RepID=UPI0039C6EE7C
MPTLDSERALVNSYDFRRAVEPAALLLPGYAPDPAVLKRLRAEHEYALSHAASTMNESALFELDSGFHEALAGFGGNPHFVQSVQQQNRLRRLFEYQGYANRYRVHAWVGEHLAIITALEEGDHARAAAALRAHLDTAMTATPPASAKSAASKSTATRSATT